MGTPDYESVGPAYDPQMQEYLDSVSSGLEANPWETPGRASSENLQESLYGTVEDYGKVQDAYAFLGTSQGQDAIQQRAAGYVDPEMVQAMTQNTTDMLQQSMATIDTGATGTGNMGSSRSALAQGSAGVQASSDLNSQLLSYQNEQIDRATSDIGGALSGYEDQIGKEVQAYQMLREIQQGDINAESMASLLNSNPNIMNALIYGSVANSSPIGSYIPE
jgi:hypothetical protein